ncbi:hypothetical protein ACFFK0_00110 [Paenibacillus chartarius]|uniref:Uncharacterized protein n=1 Tax=Paenibacillus chartarius TaxID=747481 RepID=A0ABV6DDZ8_9BACL
MIRIRYVQLAMLLMLAGLMAALAGCAASQETAVRGKKALFVGKEGGGDAIVVKHLKTLGYEVAVVADKELTAEAAEAYSLVFVSSTVNSGRVGNKLIASKTPVIYAESQNLGDIGFAGKATDEDNGDYSGRTVTIRDAKHPMAAGLQGDIDVYKADGKIGFVVPQGGVIVASAPDDEKRAVIGAIEKGTANMSGEAAPARRVYFYLVGGEEINQTDHGWKLFEAAVRWAEGEG